MDTSPLTSTSLSPLASEPSNSDPAASPVDVPPSDELVVAESKATESKATESKATESNSDNPDSGAIALSPPAAAPPAPRLNRLTQLLLLAGTVLVYSVLGMAIGNSLFISHVGAGALPRAFVLIGLCSLPAYGLFSQVVDRYSRPKLFRYVLLGSMVVALGLYVLLAQEATYAYYLLLIVVFFQWDFHNNVLYPSLLTDYFTTLEYKRYAPYVGIAQAVGTLLGGGLTTLLSHYFSTRSLLLVLPVVFGLGIAQLFYLENSQRQISTGPLAQTTNTDHAEAGLWQSLKSFPELVQRYPLALFLAGSSFLLVMIYISSEFLWFSIYGKNFSNQALTGFLGLMRIVISLVQIAVIYGATRPLLKRVGVARLNPVYPLTTLASFGALLSQFGLPAAIGLHINGDALYKAINLPVHQLNYNAIPREFVGRIRTLSDGLIYAVGLTLAGLMLWFGEAHFELQTIAWVMVGLSVLLLLVRWPMGRFYASGLESMIRSNSIDLDHVLDDLDAYAIPLNPQSAEAVGELLRDGDRYVQNQGLELARRMGQPEQFLAEVEALIDSLPSDLADDITTDNITTEIYDNAIALFAQAPHLQDHFQQQLTQPQTTGQTSTNQRQAFALELLLLNQYEASPDEIQAWQTSPQEPLQILGNLAQASVTQASVTQASVAQASANPVSSPLSWPNPLSLTAAQIIARFVTHSINHGVTHNITHNRDLKRLIPQVLLSQDDAAVLRAGLVALLNVTEAGDGETAAIAQNHLQHDSPKVRMAALDLLRVTQSPEALEALGECLGDRHPPVRQRAAKALAAYGRPGVTLAKTYLHNDYLHNNRVSLQARRAAITAIGQVRSRHASQVLFDYLTPRYRQLSQTRKWQQQLPSPNPGWEQDASWEPLRVAIADHQERLIQQVLEILSALGHGRTVNIVRRLLATPNQRELENAIEVLASLNHRRFVMPLMPLLEARVAAQSDSSQSSSPVVALPTPTWLRTKGYRLLLEALESEDRWIRTGALIALASVPSALIADPDPLVQQVAGQIFSAPHGSTSPPRQSPSPSPSSPSTTMNRLLLLKRVALFKNLSLDELLLIDQSLEQSQVRADSTIFAEGDWGVHLYIIAEGSVELVKAIDGQPRQLKQLGSGDYFGEVALFDDAPRWDSAVAQTDCTLLKLEKSRFLSLVTQRPHIILELCRFLSQRLRETDRTHQRPAHDGL